MSTFQDMMNDPRNTPPPPNHRLAAVVVVVILVLGTFLGGVLGARYLMSNSYRVVPPLTSTVR